MSDLMDFMADYDESYEESHAYRKNSARGNVTDAHVVARKLCKAAEKKGLKSKIISGLGDLKRHMVVISNADGKDGRLFVFVANRGAQEGFVFDFEFCQWLKKFPPEKLYIILWRKPVDEKLHFYLVSVSELVSLMNEQLETTESKLTVYNEDLSVNALFDDEDKLFDRILKKWK